MAGNHARHASAIEDRTCTLLNLPFYHRVHSARNLLGQNLSKATVLALQAILSRRKSLEVAHQQLRFGKHDLVFSSRIGSEGDLIFQLDIGDPRLSERFILEDDLRPNSSKLGNLLHEHRRNTTPFESRRHWRSCNQWPTGRRCALWFSWAVPPHVAAAPARLCHRGDRAKRSIAILVEPRLA
jgi:hypothetical protein